MIRPIPVQIQHIAEHGALVDMALREYRTPAEQAAYLIREGLQRAGYLTGAATQDGNGMPMPEETRPADQQRDCVPACNAHELERMALR